MTDKEKAKAYDEAIERVKKFHTPDSNNSNLKAVLEQIFPVLAVSEDERITRAINNMLPFIPDEAYANNGVTKEGVLNWLEKQKEKPMSATEVLAKAGLKPYKDGNQWCILAGDNIQEGICGFGDTIDEALYQFLMEVLEKRKEQDKCPEYCVRSNCGGCPIYENQKEQIPYIDFVIKPHKGDDTNPYDMSFSEAQEYAIKRGFDIPFNDGDVFVDERHMTQTIGNILRWADEHPKEQTPLVSKWTYEWTGPKPDKCEGCNNVKGCINCVDGDQWAHIDEEPIDPFDTKLFQDGVKEGRRLERADMQKEQKPVENNYPDYNPDEYEVVEDRNATKLVRKQKEKSEKPIIPEKENEVMKAIEGAIRVYGKTQGEWLAGYDMDTLVVHLRKAFAALEKQKEQKLAEWSEEDRRMIEDLIRACHGWAMGTIEILPSVALEYEERLKSLRPQPKKELSIEKAIQWLDDTFYFLDNSSGRGKDCEITTHDFDSLEEMYDSFRKAVTVDSEPSWKPSEDEEARKDAIKLLEAYYTDAIEDYCPHNAETLKKLIDFLKSLPERLNLQPKSEWSKEDEKIMQTMIKDGDLKPSEVAWLKSLRPQPKQEWSKEDITNGWTGVDLERYFSCLQRLGTGNPQQPETINSKWFKEHFRSQPHWKPSEEQMGALRLAIPIVKNCISGMVDHAEILESLDSDLTKILDI